MNHLDIQVSCSRWQNIIGVINAVIPELSLDARKRFRKLVTNYIARLGIEGLYEKINNKTVGQILSDVDSGPSNVIQTGVRDGVRYSLYEAPKDDACQ